MKRLFPLILIGVFATVQHLAAQGAGMGSAPAYSQSGHPTNTAHNSNQPLESAKPYGKQTGPAHVSVSIAAEEKGNPATTFSTKTPHLYGSFTTTGTNTGDRVHAVWVNSSTKKSLYKTDMTGAEANFFGTVSINAPPTGFPAGKYELDIYLGNKMLGRASFSVK